MKNWKYILSGMLVQCGDSFIMMSMYQCIWKLSACCTVWMDISWCSIFAVYSLVLCWLYFIFFPSKLFNLLFGDGLLKQSCVLHNLFSFSKNLCYKLSSLVINWWTKWPMTLLLGRHVGLICKQCSVKVSVIWVLCHYFLHDRLPYHMQKSTPHPLRPKRPSGLRPPGLSK